MAALTAELGVGLLESCGQRVDDLGGLFGRRLRLLLRWHLAEVELVENVLPCPQGFRLGKIGAERVEAQVVFLRFRTVALVAVLFEEWFECVEGDGGYSWGGTPRHEDTEGKNLEEDGGFHFKSSPSFPSAFVRRPT